MKVFLSHKMSGVPEEEVMRIRKKAVAKIAIIFKHKGETFDEFEIIDNYHHDDAPENAGRLWHLGRSIQQLEEADAIYFIPKHCRTKGCYVERLIAFLYKIPILK